MRRRYLMSRKRLLMSIIMVFTMAIATIVSIAVVFAASLNDVSTKINMKYVISGVGVKISATYSTIKNGTANSKTIISTVDGDDEFEISVSETISDDTPFFEDVNVSLNSETTKVVYEYKFTNLAERAFTIDLSVANINSENLKIRYKVSRYELPISQYLNDFDKSVLNSQAVINEGDEVYIYVSAELSDSVTASEIAGDFIWTLEGVDDEYLQTAILNHQGGTSSTNELKFISNADMPILYEIPVAADKSFAFLGYYDSTGETQYIKADGTAANVADIATGTVLYAKYTEDSSLFFELDGTTLVSMSDVGKSLSEVNIPDTVTAISDYAFVGSMTTVVNIPSSVTTIGDSAFENNGNLIEVNFEETTTVSYAGGEETSGLTNIGERAFYGCTNLEIIKIPETVISIGKDAFVGCEKLEKIIVPSITANMGNSGNIENSVGGNIIGLQFGGNSSQNFYVGKNMFNLGAGLKPSYAEFSIEGNVINLPYSVGNSLVTSANEFIQVEEEVVYNLSMTLIQGAARLGFRIYDSNKVLINDSSVNISGWSYHASYQGYWKDTTSYNILIPKGIKYVQLIFFAMNYDSNTLNIYSNLQFEKGTVATEYEEYLGTISPENPQDIVSVGERTKNLINVDDGLNSEFVKNTDGSYTFTKNSDSNRFSDYFSVDLKAGKTYTISVKETLSEALKFYQSSPIVYFSISKGTRKSTFVPTNDITSFRLYFDASTISQGKPDGTTVTFSELQIEEASLATEYEPYGYKVPITIVGKNLFNLKIYTGTTLEIYEDYSGFKIKDGYESSYNNGGAIDGSFTLKDFCPNLCVGDKFILSFETNAIRDGKSVDYFYLNEYKTSIKVNNVYKCTQEMLDSLIYIYSGNTIGVYFNNIQIEKVDDNQTSASEFECYIEPTVQNVYLDEPLRKVGNVADYIDFSTGKVVRNVYNKVVSFAANEHWCKSTNYENLYCFYVDADKFYATQVNRSINEKILSNMFYYDESKRNENNIDLSYDTTSDSGYGEQIVIGLNFETLEEVLEYFNQKKSAGYEFYINYILYQPIEQDIEIPKIIIPSGECRIIVGNTTIQATDVKVNYFVEVDPSIF